MANASLIINCADEFNSTYPQESFEIMSNVSTYIWILYSLCILGVTNNSITLYIFYRLKWFREKKMILFTNLAVIDTLHSLPIRHCCFCNKQLRYIKQKISNKEPALMRGIYVHLLWFLDGVINFRLSHCCRPFRV